MGTSRGNHGDRNGDTFWGEPPAADGAIPKIAGDPDPGPSLLDVPMSINDQDRLTRVSPDDFERRPTGRPIRERSLRA